MTTPMCRNAVRTVVKVRPTATSCRNGVRAARAIMKPNRAYIAKAAVMPATPTQHESYHTPTYHTEPPLLPHVAADEVAIVERHEVRLLHPFAEAAAEPSAGADRNERLMELKATLLRRVAREHE